MILKHRNRDLLHFEWLQPFGVRNVELASDNLRFLPLEFRETAVKGRKTDLVRKLENWLMHRTAPMSRRFVRDVMISSGFNPGDPGYLCRLLEFCKGLSLNDVHWVVPDDFTASWEDCNLYRNDFPESVGKIAFSGAGNIRDDEVSTSPEYTTNGVLAKCWRRADDGIFLWKAGSGDGNGLEPYAEHYASQVAEAMAIDHVAYRLARYRNRVCSVCPLFTDERYGFVPVGKLLTREQAAADERFADIFLFDAVIMNDDRHLGNFGFIVENETNEICGLAPAFDNGHSLFSRPPERIADATPALYENWMRYPGFNRERAKELLGRLQGFRLRKDARFNLPGGGFMAAADFLTRRIDELYHSVAVDGRGGPVKVEFTGPAGLLRIIQMNPGLRTAALAKLAGITARTAKRYLSKLKDEVVFIGPPKTGGYYLKMRS